MTKTRKSKSKNIVSNMKKLLGLKQSAINNMNDLIQKEKPYLHLCTFPKAGAQCLPAL